MQSLTEDVSPSAKKRRVGEKSPKDYFPLLLLPLKLIATIFGFLSIEDRMRARVNRQLHKMESDQRYALNTLEVHNAAEHDDDSDPPDVLMHMTKPSFVYKAALAKLAENYSFQTIELTLVDLSDYSDVFDILLTITAPEIIITIYDDALCDRLLTRERVEEIMEGRELAWFDKLSFIDLQFVLDVYEIIDSGLDTLRAFVCCYVSVVTMRKLLATLGLFVNYEHEFVSINKDVKVHKYDCDQDYMIELGKMRIFVYGIVFAEPGLGSSDLATLRIHKLKDGEDFPKFFGYGLDDLEDVEVQYVESIREDFLEAYLGDEA